MIPPLISFEMAKKQVHQISNDLDADIDAKRRLASSIAVNFCKLTSIPAAWIVESEEDFDDSTDLVLVDDTSSPPGSTYIRVPGNLQAAVQLMFGDLFENRESSSANVLSQTVIDLLTPFRDPTFA